MDIKKNRVLKILIVEDDPTARNEIKSEIDKSEGLILIGDTNSAAQALESVCNNHPDALILDLELHEGEGDGISFLEKLNTTSTKRPFILVTTNNTSTIVHERLRTLGVDFIISKYQIGYCGAYVVDFLSSMRDAILFRLSEGEGEIPESVLKLEEKSDTNRLIMKLIDDELDKIGINPRVCGRGYLSEAIQMLVVRDVPNFCQVIADRHEKTSQSVDHAMTNSIRRAWKTTPIEELERLYTAKIDPQRGYPTLAELIYYYARKIKNNI